MIGFLVVNNKYFSTESESYLIAPVRKIFTPYFKPFLKQLN